MAQVLLEKFQNRKRPTSPAGDTRSTTRTISCP
jgi:hypothetical protein